MGLIDKMAILAAPDLKRERVPVPEWGTDAEVIVQEMTALDRDRLRVELYSDDGNDPTNVACRVLVRCLITEDGSRLFVDEEADALGRKSLAAINRLFAIAKKLNDVFPDSEANIKN